MGSVRADGRAKSHSEVFAWGRYRSVQAQCSHGQPRTPHGAMQVRREMRQQLQRASAHLGLSRNEVNAFGASRLSFPPSRVIRHGVCGVGVGDASGCPRCQINRQMLDP